MDEDGRVNSKSPAPRETAGPANVYFRGSGLQPGQIEKIRRRVGLAAGKEWFEVILRGLDNRFGLRINATIKEQEQAQENEPFFSSLLDRLSLNGTFLALEGKSYRSGE